jgi:hypothetical protein
MVLAHNKTLAARCPVTTVRCSIRCPRR